MSAPARPKPDLEGPSAPFWAGVASGRLMLQRCSGCDELRYPVNAICPRCLESEHEWDEVSGEGEVFSTIVFHQVYSEAFRGEVPYNVSVVQLDDGPRMMSNVVDVAPDEVAVGDRVTVVFREIDDFVLPQFVRVDRSA